MSGARGPPLSELVESGDPDELFELIDEIAQGSYGHVFNAIDVRTSNPCALKIIALEEDETFDDLKVEIALLKQTQHANVVQFIGAWQKGEELFIAMELCDGASIDRILEHRGAGLTEEEMAVITMDSLLGLEYLHKKHMLHRDIKSANLLVNSRGECKLVDFGVSVISEPGQKRMTFIGSPYWMAPEVIDNRTLPSPYDARCDVWSMGVSLLEMADNCVPLSDLQPMVALRQIPSRDPPTLDSPGDWSDDFKDFLSKCLQKDPDDRQDTSELQKHPWLKVGTTHQVLVKMVSEFLGEDVTSLGLNNDNNETLKSPRPNSENPDDLVGQVNERTDIDETEKAMLVANLEESKKKNRPTSLRKSTQEQDKFVAQLKNQAVVKEQLKNAKKAQEKQEASTKKLKVQQDKSKDAMLKSYTTTKINETKSGQSDLKKIDDKISSERETLKKETSKALKGMEKSQSADSKNNDKTFKNAETALMKKLKDDQTKLSKEYAGQKKSQLKEKGINKKEVQNRHKEQDGEFSVCQSASQNTLSNLVVFTKKRIELLQAEFDAKANNDTSLGCARLTNLRTVQLLQRKALVTAQYLLAAQEAEGEYVRTCAETDIKDMTEMHQLRDEQTTSSFDTEVTNQKKSTSEELKRLMRVFRNTKKRELKSWTKTAKMTLKKSSDKAIVKKKQEEKKTQITGLAKQEEDKYERELIEMGEKDLAALLAYHKDSQSRLKEFQLREMDKLKKEAEKKKEELEANQKNSRSVSKKETLIEVLFAIFSNIKEEQARLKDVQTQELLGKRNSRKELEDLRGKFNLVDENDDPEWEQKLIDAQFSLQSDSLKEQKILFEKVYGNHDKMAEKLWSWRNADDLKTKLDELVPLMEVKIISAGESGTQLAQLVSEQDNFKDSEWTAISAIKETVKKEGQTHLTALLDEFQLTSEANLTSLTQEEAKVVEKFK